LTAVISGERPGRGRRACRGGWLRPGGARGGWRRTLRHGGPCSRPGRRRVDDRCDCRRCRCRVWSPRTGTVAAMPRRRSPHFETL